jgi:hypothetical protein
VRFVFIDCGHNLPVCIYADLRVQGFFNGVLSNSFPSEFSQSQRFHRAFKRIGKLYLSSHSVLDHPEARFVIVGEYAQIITLRPHGRSFFVDIANPFRCDVRSPSGPRLLASGCRIYSSIMWAYVNG